ncbi:unnamed protein product [Rhizoctonia solani]|uniref:Telomere length regulation protein conserved domain-containing protein n=1 Tax=Rhizoctonia solani TaxID=456999 RepID=A0A8H3DL07_9AGAM|nr:unnamed protein product [Rhizoctonia solani]
MTTTISVQEIISQLRQPIPSLDELETLLATPLQSLGIPTTASHRLKFTSPPSPRQLITLQATILGYVFPVWEDQTKIMWGYFCPPNGADTLVLGSLNVLTVPPLSPSAIKILDKFVQTYSLDQLWRILSKGTRDNNEIKWDETLKNWISIPAKVANAQAGEVEGPLNSETFMFETCKAVERIIQLVTSEGKPPEETTSKLVQTLIKLVQTGHFSDGLFFSATLPACLAHSTDEYRHIWNQISQNLPGPVLYTFVGSLVGLLDHPSLGSTLSGGKSGADLTTYEMANLFALFFGSANEAPPEVWNVLIGGGRSWSPSVARALVGWATRTTGGQDTNGRIEFDKGLLEEIASNDNILRKEPHQDDGISALLEQILARWTDSQHISRALLGEHRYLTSLLVLTLGVLLSSCPPAHTTEKPYDPLSFSPPSSRPTSPAPSNQPKPHPLIVKTSTSPQFIRSVGTYLSHRDESVRRCGMLVAELVSGGKLEFGGWDEDSTEVGEIEREKRREWQAWAKALRTEAKGILNSLQRDKEGARTVLGQVTKGPPTSTAEEASRAETRGDSDDKAPEPDSDDDSLIGYADRSPTSSRAPSPTPSELEDPTLRRRPIPRPVYLAELGALLVEGPKNAVEVQPADGFGLGPKTRRGMGITGGRAGGDGEDEKARVELALDVGAELIRKKRGYGSELEENAINLAYLFVGLQDNFDLDRFEERRQTVLVALVACCPTKAAPTIIEQFFHHQYSTAQRFTMLNALALGARELAGLPIPSPPSDTSKRPRIDFPSKVLPGVAHLEYMQEGDLPPPANRIEGSSRYRIEGMTSQVSTLVNDLSGMAITRSKQETEDSIPQIVRERSLRVGLKPGRGIAPIDSDVPTKLGYLSTQTPVIPFAQVAAEYFVAPLVNRFWAHLQSSMAHESYARRGSSLSAGVGTGMILSPLVVTHLMGTLAVLLHAARHAPPFLHVLAPDAAELALSVGTRPLSRSGDEGTEAGVLAGALELALTVLDSALELDGGQVFALERSDLLLGIGQWASTVFEALDKGERAPGVGGKDEERAVRIAAGLVLTSERIVSKWRRTMSLN